MNNDVPYKRKKLMNNDVPYKRKKLHNKLDPIMLTPLRKHIFKYNRPNGIIIAYNIRSLIRYILSSGDFTEPETKIPFTDLELNEIDMIAKQAGYNCESVYDAKYKRIDYYQKKNNINNILLNFDSLMGECSIRILQLIESDIYDSNNKYILLYFFIPELYDLYRKLYKLNPIYAKQCLKNYKIFINGPKNKPTIDKNNLLPIFNNLIILINKYSILHKIENLINEFFKNYIIEI